MNRPKSRRPIDQLALRRGPLGAALIRLARDPGATVLDVQRVARAHGARIEFEVTS